MSDPSASGIHLTKDYYKDFLPTDLQWNVSKVDDNFTLYDLFRLIYHAEMMIPGISTTMGMVKFKEFWEQIQLDRDPQDCNDIQYLNLYWSPSYDTRVTKKTGKSTDQTDSCLPIDKTKNYWEDPYVSELPNLMGLHGIGDECPEANFNFHECGDDCEKTTSYAIEFTPINNLAHLPVRVSPEIQFFPPYVESDRDFKRTGLTMTINPTLWCFITSIFWELTFAGSCPDEIENQRNIIIENMEDAKDHLKKMGDNKDGMY